MHGMLLLLILIVAANGAPILVRYILGERMSFPVDFYQNFFDEKRIFGNTKTWTGLSSIPVASITAAWILSIELKVGILVGLGVMIGDLFSSFVKRRFGIKESSMVIGLDQIPESLFPLLMVQDILGFSVQHVALAVVAFIIFELLVSRLLYWMHIRKQPY